MNADGKFLIDVGFIALILTEARQEPLWSASKEPYVLDGKGCSRLKVTGLASEQLQDDTPADRTVIR
jgi:hypothetical protein